MDLLQDAFRNRNTFTIWESPFIASFTLAVFSVVLALTFYKWENRNVEITIDREVEAVRYHLVSEIEGFRLGLARMAQRVERGMSESEWETDATLYVNHEKSYLAIDWVDINYVIRWLVPKTRYGNLVKADLHDGGKREKAFKAATTTGRAQFTESLDLLTGGKGFLLITPINKGPNRGFIVGVFQYDPLIDRVLAKQIDAGFSIELFEGGNSVYTGLGYRNYSANSFARNISIPVNGVNWNMGVILPNAYMASHRSYMLHLILGFGLLLSVALYFLVRYARVVKRQNHHLKLNIETH